MSLACRRRFLLWCAVSTPAAFCLGAGPRKAIKVRNKDNPGARDAIRVKVVEAEDRHIGDDRELAVCISVTGLMRGRKVSCRLWVEYDGRQMKPDGAGGIAQGYPIGQLRMSETNLVIFRIKCKEGEGAGELAKLSGEVARVTYSDS